MSPAKSIKKRFLFVKFTLLALFSKRRISLSNEGPIVSLTSYGNRLSFVYLAIESIIQGDVPPRRILLWVEDPLIVKSPSLFLRRQQLRGVEILLSEKLGPHTKYFPFVSRQASTFVTADDDMFYPHYWLSNLLKEHLACPNKIICYRGHEIAFNKQSIERYDLWTEAQPGSSTPLVFFTGVFGALYPKSFSIALQKSGKGFIEKAFQADDIWLNHVAFKSKITPKIINCRNIDFISTPMTQSSSLKSINVAGGRNDKILAATYSQSDIIELQNIAKYKASP